MPSPLPEIFVEIYFPWDYKMKTAQTRACGREVVPPYSRQLTIFPSLLCFSENFRSQIKYQITLMRQVFSLNWQYSSGLYLTV